MASSYKLELARFSALLRIQDGAECGNIETEFEGAQVQYDRTPIIHMWCKPEVKLEKFYND